MFLMDYDDLIFQNLLCYNLSFFVNNKYEDNKIKYNIINNDINN